MGRVKIAPKPANEAARLQALLEADILDTAPEIDFDDVAELIASICATPIALVSLIDAERQWFKAKIGFEFSEAPRDVAFCAHAILEPDVFVVPNAIDDERFFDNPLVVGEAHVRFYAGAPITTREGYNVGEVCVMDRMPRSLTEKQGAALRTLARQVATQMEVRRLNQLLRTRSRQMEDARRQLDDLLTNATDLIVLVGERGQIKYVNRAWTHVLGYDVQQSVGRPIFDVVAPDERARCEILFDDLYVGNILRSTIIDFLTVDGRRVTLEGGASVRRDETGNIHAIRLIFRDITERRALEQQRQVFEDLVTNATDAIVLWRRSADGALRLRFANAAARALSPVPLDQSLGLGIHDVFPDLVDRVNGQTLDISTPVTYETSMQLGPTTFDLRVSLVPLPGDNLGTIIENIRERKAIERMKDEFVSTVSHELRTPLTSIRGALGLIEGQVFGDLPPEVTELVGIARTSTDHLIRLINDLLDIEKLDAGKLELKIACVEVQRLFAATLNALQPHAAERSIKIESYDERQLLIAADADRIEQVLTNLVTNAVKFSPEGSTIRLRAMRVDAQRVRISVQDEGPGISEAHQMRLFGRFQQIDSTDRRQHGGTGLGLAICKAIVEEHGGTIGVQSEVGQGSTFFFELRAMDAVSERVNGVES